jgi:hypothetical protein|tara:strand:+ start:707 stop:1468 length:762 start_codon:yes stop_codon:yes gene_type:complete
MALTASAGSGGESTFETVPPGSYEAICYRLVDAGTAEEDYKGEISKKHKIYIFWEIPELTLSDGRPYSIFHGYTLSLNERSNLRRDLQAWRNKPFTEDELQAFDLTKLLGVTCKISVVLNSNGNPKIDGIFCSDGGAKRVETTNPTSVFDLEEYCKEFSGEASETSKAQCDVYEELPRFIQWRIGGCDEADKDPVRPCFEVAAAQKKGQPAPVAAAPQRTTGLEAMAKDQAKAAVAAAETAKNEPLIDDDIPF